MDNLIINESFKNRFKEISRLKTNFALNELLTVFDLPENIWTHSILNLFYKKLPNVYLDKDFAKQMVRDNLGEKGFYFLDYDRPFYGGYPTKKPMIANHDGEITDKLILETKAKNWTLFENELQSNYWNNELNRVKFSAYDDLTLYEDRLPKNPKEAYMCKDKIAIVNGIEVKISRSFFFMLKNVTTYYESLINVFLCEFRFDKKLSNKKSKRFVKNIGKGLNLALCVDFNFLEKGLKMGYMEFPKIDIEVFSDKLNSYVSQADYLKNTDEYDIAWVGGLNFIGAFSNLRIGNSSQDELELKKKLFYHFDIYSFYLKLNLKLIKENLMESF